MKFEFDTIRDMVDRLGVVLHIYKDRCLYKRGKLVVVEGSTDKQFIDRFKERSVICISADNVFKSNNVFSINNNKTAEQEKVNCKDAIMQVITGTSKFSAVIKYPKDFCQWDVYGMIDADYDSKYDLSLPRLFVTDTHDLETLLLSTDETLLLRLNNCNVTKKEIDDSLYLAYQLSIVRQELFGNDFEKLKKSFISCGTCQVDFSCFVYENKINVFNLIEYVAKKSQINNRSQIEKFKDKICKNKKLKNKINSEGIWKMSALDFFKNQPTDIWNIINGHDLLQILCYLNESAKNAFCHTNAKLNREFEVALINEYDHKQFFKTQICKNMTSAGLIGNGQGL